MVRDGEIKTKQADDGSNQFLGLPQGQAEHRPQCQRRRDCQGRVVWLAAPCGPRFGTPGGDRRLGEPDRQTAALAQGCVIIRPVRHPLPLSRDVVATGSIGFDRHGGHPMARPGETSILPGGRHQPADPCNMVV